MRIPILRSVRATFPALAALFLATPGTARSAACRDPLDSDFRRVVVVPNGTDAPSGDSLMQMDLAPDGRIFWAAKNGSVRVFDPATRTARLLGQVPVNAPGYMGLLSLALDPEYPVRPFVYLLFNPASNANVYTPFRVARFRLAETLDLASEKILIEIPNRDNKMGPEGTHTGGKLAFGPGRELFITSGDNSQWADYNPVDERLAEGTALSTSGNTNVLGGKVLRLLVDGDGKVTIPAGNLFAPGTAKTRPEIFAMGMRNPYSIHVDAATGWVLVGEVGPQGPSAVSPRGPAGGEELLAMTGPGNHGWPMFYGRNVAYTHFDFATSAVGAAFDPAHPVNDSKWNTGLRELPPALPATVTVEKYRDDTTGIGLWNGGGQVIVAGPIYRYRPGLASPIKLPPSLHGRWIVGDAAAGRLGWLALDKDAGNAIGGHALFNQIGLGGSLDLRIGPDGALYALEFQPGRISRVEYTGPDFTPAQCGLAVGCTDRRAPNYSPAAVIDDGSCSPLPVRSVAARPEPGRPHIVRTQGTVFIEYRRGLRVRSADIRGRNP